MEHGRGLDGEDRVRHVADRTECQRDVRPTGTSHTVQLTGLTPNRRYRFTVIATELAGNTTTSPSGTPAT